MCAHVYDGYLEAVEKSGKNNIICHVDNIPFDPEARLCGYNRNLDLATFDFSYDDLMKAHPVVPGSSTSRAGG